MAIMVAAVGALAAFYHDSTDINDPQQRMIASMRMIAKIPTLAAMAFKYTIGQPFMYPKNSLSFAENFLHMCFAVPCEDYKINPVLADALDKIFILHADHEQNASTSTVRIAGSSGANPFACIAAGIACLWGPAHGGANEAALAMLADIGTVDKIPEFIRKVKDKNSEVRLMGFGHRVYKNYDPRAKIMQKMCHAVLAETGHGDDPMLKVALELEKIALSDQYFIDRKLYPNVDFYSGITLKAMGFPTSMFTVLFAVARTVGWISQWSEMIEDPAAEDRPSAPALYRRRPPRLRRILPSASKRGEALRQSRQSRMRSQRPAFLIPRDGLSREAPMFRGSCLCGERRLRSRRRTRPHRSLPLRRLPQGPRLGLFDGDQRPARPVSLDHGENLIKGFGSLARQEAIFLHAMRIAYRRRARGQRHHPAADGVPGQPRHHPAAEGAHLGDRMPRRGSIRRRNCRTGRKVRRRRPDQGSRRPPRLAHRGQHDVGRPCARRLVAGRHDVVDPRKASSCRRRKGVSARTSRNAGNSFFDVQSAGKNSGTTFSPTTRLARMTEFDRIMRCMIQASTAPIL